VLLITCFNLADLVGKLLPASGQIWASASLVLPGGT